MAVTWKKLAYESDTVLKAATSTSGWGFVVDEDNMASDLDTKVPTQQSVKAYVDAKAGSQSLACYRNLTAAQASNTTTTIAADTIILENSTGATLNFGALSETLTITASGANGLDTGSEAVSTWYHIWAIGKADGTLDGLLSASATAPTLPAGYSYKLYLGAVYNNASGNFVAFSQKDNKVGVDLTIFINASTATAYTAFTVSTLIPPTATQVVGAIAEYGSSSSSRNEIYISGYSTGYGAVETGATQTTNIIQFSAIICQYSGSGSLYYKVAATSGTAYGYVYLSGWVF